MIRHTVVFRLRHPEGLGRGGYNARPEHARFARERRMPEVEDFLEIDYAPL